MAITWDPTDVPTIAAEDLAAPMRELVAKECGLIFLRGLTPEDARIVESCLRQRLGRDPSLELAVLMRFRALVEVFAYEPLLDLFLDHGFEMIGPAIEIAASMRLNKRWGFNPQYYYRGVSARLEGGDSGVYYVTRELLDAT